MTKRIWTVALVLALALAQLPVRPAYAATITVDTTSDVLDAAGGNCGAVTIASRPGPDGFISLREAMCAANNNAGSDTIAFSIVGCGWVCTIQPSIALPIMSGDGTIIDGYTQTGAVPATDTSVATLKIEIDGTNVANNNGFNIISAGNVISGVVINRFGGNGVYIGGSGATGNVIAGNHIGTDVGSKTVMSNTLDGVYIGEGAQNNTVGGDIAAKRNVLSGNGWEGVAIHGSNTMSNTVSGNYIGIGTRAGGTADLGNTEGGVYISSGAQNNAVGGDTAGERNVISGNNAYGVRIAGSGTTSNTVSGNYIGVNITGTAVLSNTGSGVHIISGAQNNTVGGDTAGERNVISGNDGDGVYISGSGATSNTVSGNYIGTDVNGTAVLSNAGSGVRISSFAQNNTVGPGNVIAHNDGDGVEVSGSSTTGNTITHNSIYSNAMGIDLVGGANGNIAAPVIITTTAGSVNIVGTACANCTVEVFANSNTDGEGETYLGSATAAAGGAFTVTVSALYKPYLTATATKAISGTSEFSAVFTSTLAGATVYLPIILKNASP